jgi:hypothetical protein
MNNYITIKSDITPENLESKVLDYARQVAGKKMREQAMQAANMRMNMLRAQAMISTKARASFSKPPASLGELFAAMNLQGDCVLVEDCLDPIQGAHQFGSLSASERSNYLRLRAILKR